MQFQYDMQQQNNRANAAALAAQVNQMNTAQQLEIAQLPIDQITMKYQVDAATAEGWKDAVSQAGGITMNNALSQFKVA